MLDLIIIIVERMKVLIGLGYVICTLSLLLPPSLFSFLFFSRDRVSLCVALAILELAL